MQRHFIIALMSICLGCFLPQSAAAIKSGDSNSSYPRVLRPENLRYDEYIKSHYSRISNDASYNAFRSNTLIFRNTSKFPIISLVIKWTIFSNDGSKTVIFRPLSAELLRFGGLPGNRALLQPDQGILVSPIADVVESSSLTSEGRFLRLMADPTLTAQFAGAAKVVGSVDSLLFGSGALLGADKYGIIQKFSCERNGAIDEAKEILTDPKNGVALLQQLNQRLTANLKAENSGASCSAARAGADVRFIKLYQKRDLEEFQQQLQFLANARKITITRWQPNTTSNP